MRGPTLRRRSRGPASNSDLTLATRHVGGNPDLPGSIDPTGRFVHRGCARVEWWVLRSNVRAIRFYQRLRARGLDEIEVMRLDGTALGHLGRHPDTP